MTQNHFASSLKSKNEMWIGVTTAAHLYRTNLAHRYAIFLCSLDVEI